MPGTTALRSSGIALEGLIRLRDAIRLQTSELVALRKAKPGKRNELERLRAIASGPVPQDASQAEDLLAVPAGEEGRRVASVAAQARLDAATAIDQFPALVEAWGDLGQVARVAGRSSGSAARTMAVLSVVVWALLLALAVASVRLGWIACIAIPVLAGLGVAWAYFVKQTRAERAVSDFDRKEGYRAVGARLYQGTLTLIGQYGELQCPRAALAGGVSKLVASAHAAAAQIEPSVPKNVRKSIARVETAFEAAFKHLVLDEHRRLQELALAAANEIEAAAAAADARRADQQAAARDATRAAHAAAKEYLAAVAAMSEQSTALAGFTSGRAALLVRLSEELRAGADSLAVAAGQAAQAAEEAMAGGCAAAESWLASRATAAAEALAEGGAAAEAAADLCRDALQSMSERACATDEALRGELATLIADATGGEAARRAALLDELRRAASEVRSVVEASVEERHWSLAAAAPGGAAFTRMGAFRSAPQEFDQVRVLRYSRRDVLRLGTSDARLPSTGVDPLPLHLNLFEDPQAPPPMAEVFPVRNERSIVVAAKGPDRAMVADGLVRQLALRSLGLRPPGLVQLFVIDPLRSGASFREVGQLQGIAFQRANLASDSQSIEAMLRRMREDMTNTIMASSSGGDQTIDDALGNDRLSSSAFRTVCVFGYPRGFDERSMSDLEQLCRSGDQAGIHVILSLHDQEMEQLVLANPNAAKRDTFRGAVAWIRVEEAATRRAHIATGDSAANVPFTIDAPFGTDEVDLLVRAFRHDSEVRDTRRLSPVEAASALREAPELVSVDPSREVSLMLGTELAEGGKPACIPFGRDIAHHALLVGATGSGKTRLLQGIVATACLRYRPDELQFWLLDFKSGTGFKPFASAGVPHCRVVGLSSDVTYGLDALDKLLAEMNRRQVLFKRHSVENLEQYAQQRRRSQGGMDALPRIIAIIDEFQTLFGRDTATTARVRMAQIVQKGRSAGIHLFLSTQSLEGQAADIDSLRSQIKVNVVLQSSASTQRGVLDRDEYTEVQKLRRFEGLLDVDGRKTIFDVLDMPDSEDRVNPNLLDALDAVRHAAEGLPQMLVYDGDAEVPFPSVEEFRTLSRKVRDRARLEGVPIIPGLPAAVTDLPAFAELRAAMNGNVVISTADDLQAEVHLASVLLSIWASEGVESVEVDVLQSERMGRAWRILSGGFPEGITIREHDSAATADVVRGVAESIPGRGRARRRILLVREWTLSKAFMDSGYSSGSEDVVAVLATGPAAGVHVVAATASGRRLPSDVRDYYAVRMASSAAQELHSASGFNPVAVGRMFVEDPSRPDACSEYLPHSFDGGIPHV